MIYFSPTGTTKKVLESIAEGINLPIEERIDLSRLKPDSRTLDDQVLTIIGVPVYAGRVPLHAIERLSVLRAQSTPTIIVVVYGNRAYEDALIELKYLVLHLGYDARFAGAFICEHSWNSDDHQIANGRPDTKDLQKAKEFGETIQITTSLNKEWGNNSQLLVPGNPTYRERKEFPKIAPVVDSELCNLCEKCEESCPVSAVTITNEVKMDENKCSLCSSCIKKCPQKAIRFKDPWLKNVINWLVETYHERKEPELFY